MSSPIMSTPSLGEWLTRSGEPPEMVVGVVRARLPRPGTSVGSFVGIVYLVQVVDLVLRRGRQAKLAARYAEAGFSVSPRMLLVATGERLIIVRATRRWRPESVLGTVAKADITNVTFAYVGGARWKVLRIERTDGSGVQIWADTSTAADFLAAFQPPGS